MVLTITGEKKGWEAQRSIGHPFEQSIGNTKKSEPTEKCIRRRDDLSGKSGYAGRRICFYWSAFPVEKNKRGRLPDF